MNPQIKRKMEHWEGREYHAYPDPLSLGDPWTVGIGHTGPEVHKGTFKTDEEIDADFEEDWSRASEGVMSHLPWAGQLVEARLFVLVCMAFQMGVLGLLKFTKTLAAVRDGHFPHAAEMMRDSLWARQTPIRANALADQMATGEWQ